MPAALVCRAARPHSAAASPSPSGPLKSPYPYFGGKSRVAAAVWSRFGATRNYVEPFFGSGAMLLGRPMPFRGPETVNDADGYIANFWRALKADPDGVARHADWPASECDLHARHAWLTERRESLRERLEGDPEYHDTRIAGWWVWGMACWIGGGFCGGGGPWIRRTDAHGVTRLQRRGRDEDAPGVCRNIIRVGRGGVLRTTLRRGPDESSGVYDWMRALAERMRHVRVCCGGWSRVCTRATTTRHGLTAVFLDPPYGGGVGRDPNIYAHESLTVAADVRAWCVAHGDDPLLRIALCGYEGEHEDLVGRGWSVMSWRAHGGYANQGQRRAANKHRERVWFSPHCLPA